MILYGYYIKQLNNDHFDITHYKKPSKIDKVDYATLIDELYEAELHSDDYKHYLNELYEGDATKVEQEQMFLKKMIVNVAIGSLGKNTIKKLVLYHLKIEMLPTNSKQNMVVW